MMMMMMMMMIHVVVSFMMGEDEFGFCSTHTTHQTRHDLPRGRTTSGNFIASYM